jgi:hypothetical protein
MPTIRVDSSLEGGFSLGVENPTLATKEQFGEAMCFENDHLSPMPEKGSEEQQVGALLPARDEEPTLLGELREEAMGVAVEIKERDAVLHPRPELQELDVGRPLTHEGEALVPVGTDPYQGVTFTPTATMPERLAGHVVARLSWRRTTEVSLITVSSKAASFESSLRLNSCASSTRAYSQHRFRSFESSGVKQKKEPGQLARRSVRWRYPSLSFYRFRRCSTPKPRGGSRGRRSG